MRFSVTVAALCAFLTPLPLLAANPEFVRGPAAWLGLGAASVLAGLFCSGFGAGLARLANGRPALGAWWGVGTWLLLAIPLAAGVRGIESGLAGLLPLVVLVGILLFRNSASGPAAAFALATLAAVALPSLWAIAGRAPEPPPRQVVLIGLDGASWEIIDDLRAAGRLPTFDRLLARGVRADLDTFPPTFSPAVWTTIATGRKREHHGVLDFWATARQVRSKRLWEIVDERGLVSGVFGYLVTWPPRKESGFLVPGWLAQDERTIPPELAPLQRLELRSRAGSADGPTWIEMLGIVYGGVGQGMTFSSVAETLRASIGDSVVYDASLRRTLEGWLASTPRRVDLFCELVRRTQPSLAVFYDHHIDATEHLFFRYFEPEAFENVPTEMVVAFGDAIHRVYETTDRAIDRISRCVSADATLIVVSDHGQRAAANSRAPRWIRAQELLESLGIAGEVRAQAEGGRIHLIPKSREGSVEAALEAIRSAVTIPDGRRIFLVDEQPPYGVSVRNLEPGSLDEIQLGDNRVPASRILGASPNSGVHTQTAMFLVSGPDTRHGAKLPRGSVLDIAPTTLALLGLPLARDMEGRVLLDAIRPSRRSHFTPSYVDTHGVPANFVEDSPEVELDDPTQRNLKALGYIQ